MTPSSTPGGATERPWEISEARTADGHAMIVGGAGQAFGLIAVVTRDEDAALILAAIKAYDAPDSKLEAYRKALEDEIEILQERHPRKFLENSLCADALQWQRLTAVKAVGG